MASIGTTMLDEQKGWWFFTTRFGMFHAIPEAVVIHWLESAGVDGARKISRHLTRP
jgi:hypothetical protein